MLQLTLLGTLCACLLDLEPLSGVQCPCARRQAIAPSLLHFVLVTLEYRSHLHFRRGVPFWGIATSDLRDAAKIAAPLVLSAAPSQCVNIIAPLVVFPFHSNPLEHSMFLFVVCLPDPCVCPPHPHPCTQYTS